MNGTNIFSFKFLFFLWIAFFIAPSVSAQNNVIQVSNGKPVLVDGKCLKDEWREASKVPIRNEYKLYFKKSPDFVFICLEQAKESNLMADLYLSAAEGKLYTLHASAKLGERILIGEKWQEWTEDWNWWNVDGWWANTLKFDSFEERTFLPGKAIEFQISRRRFTGKKWRVMLDIVSGNSGIFPPNADKLKSDSWLKLNL